VPDISFMQATSLLHLAASYSHRHIYRQQTERRRGGSHRAYNHGDDARNRGMPCGLRHRSIPCATSKRHKTPFPRSAYTFYSLTSKRRGRHEEKRGRAKSAVAAFSLSSTTTPALIAYRAYQRRMRCLVVFHHTSRLHRSLAVAFTVLYLIY